jgi:hypothetical protein
MKIYILDKDISRLKQANLKEDSIPNERELLNMRSDISS